MFTKLEVKRNRPITLIGQQLGVIVDREKASAKPIGLIKMRVAAKAKQLLFKELVKELT